jgi:hypothetical protein
MTDPLDAYPDHPNATARQVADRAAARVVWLNGAASTYPTDHPGYDRAINTMVGEYTRAHLMRALIQHAPEHADKVAKGLRNALDDGGGIVIDAATWVLESGGDPAAITTAGETHAQAATGGTR